MTMRVKFPLKGVMCLCVLFKTSTDSAGDVKKTHKESMYPAYLKGTGQGVIRHSEGGYGFKTTGQEQNRSIRYSHPSKQAERSIGEA